MNLLLDKASSCPGQLKSLLKNKVSRAVEFANIVAENPNNETECRRASGGLYHAKTATLLASEGTKLGAEGGDARRLILARLVVDTRLTPRDPLAVDESPFQTEASKLLINEAPVSLNRALEIISL